MELVIIFCYFLLAPLPQDVACCTGVFLLPIPLAIIEVILMPVSEGAANIVTIGYLVDGKSLFYIPSLENERDVAWQCRSVDIDPGLLPVNCRD